MLVDPERVTPADRRRGALGSLLAAAAWIALARWRPTVTYHLAPVLVAGIWPYLLRRGPLRVSEIDARRAAIAGLAVALLSALALVALDLMRGPTLWDRGHALVEIVPAAFVGAFTGYRLARCSPAG